MATFSHEHLAFFFGFLGNFISFMVYFAPLVTFYEIYRRGTTANFHAIPYAVALFSATLMLYYAHLKGNEMMLLIINAFGCGIETTYLIAFFIYANAKARRKAAQLVIGFNVGVYGLIVLFTSLVSPASHRVKVVGWICAAVSVCVFAAPLSIMRHVIRTKSVEFMPFPLSVCLTLSAIFWFCYGFFIKDFFVAMPNTLGFLFGTAQIVLYFMYRNARRDEENAREMQNNAVNAASESLAENVYKIAEGIVGYINYRAVEEHEQAENGNDNLQQQENVNPNAGNSTEPHHVQNENHFVTHPITVAPANEVVVEMPTVGNDESTSVEEAAPAPLKPSVDNV